MVLPVSSRSLGMLEPQIRHDHMFEGPDIFIAGFFRRLRDGEHLLWCRDTDVNGDQSEFHGVACLSLYP